MVLGPSNGGVVWVFVWEGGGDTLCVGEKPQPTGGGWGGGCAAKPPKGGDPRFQTHKKNVGTHTGEKWFLGGNRKTKKRKFPNKSPHPRFQKKPFWGGGGVGSKKNRGGGVGGKNEVAQGKPPLRPPHRPPGQKCWKTVSLPTAGFFFGRSGGKKKETTNKNVPPKGKPKGEHNRLWEGRQHLFKKKWSNKSDQKTKGKTPPAKKQQEKEGFALGENGGQN